MLNMWQPDDLLMYRVETDPPGHWRSAGTLQQIENEWRRSVSAANVAFIVDAVIASVERQHNRLPAQQKELTYAASNLS